MAVVIKAFNIQMQSNTQALYLFFCAHLRSEHIEIVVPVVMEMFRRVHQKFILYYSIILPPIGRKMLFQPHAVITLVNENKGTVHCTLMLAEHCKAVLNWIVFDAQDTGISVRKRVIKILRDICLEQPTFSKITEMCVRMIRRVNDEEGIKVWINCIFGSLHF